MHFYFLLYSNYENILKKTFDYYFNKNKFDNHLIYANATNNLESNSEN